MKFKNTSLLVLGVILAVGGATAWAQDEDLGALARAEREKREKENKKPAKVLTNEDVSTSPTGDATGMSSMLPADATKRQRIKSIAILELSIVEYEEKARAAQAASPQESEKIAKMLSDAVSSARAQIESIKKMAPPLTEADLPPTGPSLHDKAARVFALMSASERASSSKGIDMELERDTKLTASDSCTQAADAKAKSLCQMAQDEIEMLHAFQDALRNAPPPPPEEPNPANLSMNHASATAALRTLNTAEVAYASTYSHGYTHSLEQLGPAPDGKPSDAHAGMIDLALAGGKKSGYTFTYVPHISSSTGLVNSYELYADPVQFGVDGSIHLFTNDTYVIHKAKDNRQATAQDPKL